MISTPCRSMPIEDQFRGTVSDGDNRCTKIAKRPTSSYVDPSKGKRNGDITSCEHGRDRGRHDDIICFMYGVHVARVYLIIGEMVLKVQTNHEHSLIQSESVIIGTTQSRTAHTSFNYVPET